MVSKQKRTHGHAEKGKFTPEYHSWVAMKTRINNPNCNNFRNYGGRGLAIDDPRWDSFENFFADMGGRPPGLTLERRDNDKGYSRDNCYWNTRTEQNNNQRRVKLSRQRAVLIRERISAGIATREIAKEFEMSAVNVNRIKRAALACAEIHGAPDDQIGSTTGNA